MTLTDETEEEESEVNTAGDDPPEIDSREIARALAVQGEVG